VVNYVADELQKKPDHPQVIDEYQLKNDMRALQHSLASTSSDWRNTGSFKTQAAASKGSFGKKDSRVFSPEASGQMF